MFLNQRGGGFRERQVPPQFPRVAAIAAAEITGDGFLDVVGVAPNGTLVRLSQPSGRASFEAVARIEAPSALAAGSARLLAADLDNNGAVDFVASGPDGSRGLLAAAPGAFRSGPANLPGNVFRP